ncbi:hypothetical protein V144x_33000 [Gimesia aquarii]|uniref:Uncharacterized protein n=1 Tax=Gimesia aquarii TaxID=2527964 RepID=A0A517VXV1_9PLAN|nr:hypothetical protein V144x_33000 [Gimesia aquarii]
MLYPTCRDTVPDKMQVEAIIETLTSNNSTQHSLVGEITRKSYE